MSAEVIDFAAERERRQRPRIRPERFERGYSLRPTPCARASCQRMILSLMPIVQERDGHRHWHPRCLLEDLREGRIVPT